MSFPNDRTYTPDINNFLSDNAAPYTTTGYLQVGGANQILDLGGNQGTSPVQQARMDCVAVIDVTALKISSGNETYKFYVVVSNDPGLATGNVVAGGAEVGKGASLDIPNAGDNVTGRLEIMFSNNVAGSIYEYVGVYLAVGGTTPSISVEAFLAVLPEI